MTGTILLVGESDVGKSHFGGQLLGRLNQELGALRMKGAPPSIEPFETVLACLNAGRAAPHTSQDRYVESLWPLTDAAGRSATLVWPDYGGEQVRMIRSERRMSADWRDRVMTASSWLVMVRVAHAQLSDDVFTRPIVDPDRTRDRAGQFEMSTQAQLIDLLQWLMFVRRTGTLRPIAGPPLMLLLSCWDELPDAQLAAKPRDVLGSRLPMLSAFIESNWRPGSLHVLGLSALERPLREDAVDEEFVDRGPEAFGYVVLEDGRRNPDLTLTVAPLV